MNVISKMYFRFRVMKMKLLVILFFCFMFVNSIQTFAQDVTPVVGIMLDESTFEPVQLANILIRNTGSRHVSNRKGYFHFMISATDSVYISAIGYKTKFVFGQNLISQNVGDTIKIYLRQTVYKLKDVNVYYPNHKRDSIARLAAEFLKTDPLLNNYDRVTKRNKGSMMSPLTAMYEAWSKEGQDMQKFEEFLQFAEEQKAVDRRYNKKVIKKITEIEDEDLDEFIRFCKIDRYFIITAQEYDLYAAIKKCGDEFNAKHLRDRMKLR